MRITNIDSIYRGPHSAGLLINVCVKNFFTSIIGQVYLVHAIGFKKFGILILRMSEGGLWSAYEFCVVDYSGHASVLAHANV